jgi:Arc/MetJ family transcription regulator
MVYAHPVKRLQILIDEDLAAELERVSVRTGLSKGALVRDAVRRQIKPLPRLEQDPIWELAGAASFDPVPPDEIDDIVYGES